MQKKCEVFFSFDEVGGFFTFKYVLLPVILNYIFNINEAFQVAFLFLIDARNLSRVLCKCYRHELSLLRRRQGQSSQSLDLAVSGHDIENSGIISIVLYTKTKSADHASTL